MLPKNDPLKGRKIATFSLSRNRWEVWIDNLSLIVLPFWLVTHYLFHWSPDFLWPLVILLPFPWRHRDITFHEKGITLPKNAGTVFFTRDQLLKIQLVGDRFSVIGPDADWNGPYAGGTFQIPESALPRLREVLSQFLAST
jgi:hypothetical protein